MGITTKQRGKQVFANIVGLGEWLDVPFDPGNFTGNAGMTWTVTPPVLTNRYCRIGNAIVWNLFVATSTIGGTLNNTLYVVSPTSYKIARYMGTACLISNGAPFVVGVLRATASVGGTAGVFGVTFSPFANFAAGAVQLEFSVTYEYGDAT